MSDREIDVDAWAMVRAQFGQRESVRAIIPWGGTDAVLVTDFAVYRLEPDKEAGFIAKMMFSR